MFKIHACSNGVIKGQGIQSSVRFGNGSELNETNNFFIILNQIAQSFSPSLSSQRDSSTNMSRYETRVWQVMTMNILHKATVTESFRFH